MELVWLTPGTPFPPDQGERVVTFNRIKRLTDRGHDVHVLSVVDEEAELERADDMVEFCESATFAPRRRGAKLYAQNPRLPYSVASRYVPELRNRLDELVSGADVVLTEHTNMAEYARELDVPTCVSIHNVVTKTLFGMARSKFPSPKAIPYAIESARMCQYERSLYSNGRFDSYAFLSIDERAALTDRYPNISQQTFVSPVGVDVERFSSVGPLPAEYRSEQTTIVFTGTMRYEPNVDAAEWFVDSVFPVVRSAIPSARFLIVGKEPVARVRRLAERPGVTVTGRVPSVEPFIDAADVVVVPIREGAGVKIKLLEALASDSPVVSTANGIEGVAVEHGEHLWVEDEEGFATRIVEVLANPEDHRRVAANGRELVAERYAWPTVIDGLESHLHELAER
jgi:sugar transferase (PEP-CTERM/EpsH1 system associated)